MAVSEVPGSVSGGFYPEGVGEKPSFIEFLTPAGPGPSQLGIFRIRPVVVDTSFLLPDVVWSARHRQRSMLLECVEFGLLRPFAAHHVWAEVPRKIGELASDAGVNRQLVEAVWWREYVSRIQFVDVDGVSVPRFGILALRDPSDLPTFALAELLAPVVVLAADRDLRDPGIAAPNWIALVQAGDTMTIAASGTWGSLVAVRLGGYAIMSAGRGVGRLARHPAGQVALVAAAFVLALTSHRWWPKVREHLSCARPRFESFIDRLLPIVSDVMERYETAQEAWESATTRPGSPTLDQDRTRPRDERTAAQSNADR